MRMLSDQDVTLEKLKNDPQIWMRLATPSSDGDVLRSVFSEEEKPFEKNSAAAMEKIQKLAADGKLYLREFGRSKHFREVKIEGENLKLGDLQEQKLRNVDTDPVLGLLMRFSRRYFNWIGFDGISGWFDKRIKRREALVELDDQYKKEYDTLSKEQKKELKKLRKQEKKELRAQKRLQKAEKEISEARIELQQIRGEEKTAELPLIVQGQEFSKDLLDALPKNVREAAETLFKFAAQQRELERTLKNNSGVMGDPNKLQNQINAPLEHQPVPEGEKFGIQKELNGQDVPPQNERLAAEKQALEGVKNWKERVANALFSHEQGADLKAKYDAVKDNVKESFDYLTGAMVGVLSQNKQSPEKQKQIANGLINGQSLGNENNAVLRAGMEAFTNANNQLKEGKPGAMAQMLADAAVALCKAAKDQRSLSPEQIMTGRMLSNVMAVADENKLRLPLDQQQWADVKGAFTIAQAAQKYYDARQYLGNGNMDTTTEKGREAVRDLLAGNAIDRMLRNNADDNAQLSDIQALLGQGEITVNKLQQMTNNTSARRDITPEQIKNMLDQPDGLTAANMGNRVSTELVDGMMKEQTARRNTKQKERQVDNRLLKEPNLQIGENA